jgi:uncharacterized protein
MSRTSETIHIPLSEGHSLRGSLSVSEATSDFAILYVHGLGGHRGGEKSAALEDACAKRKITFAAFDFRGHGESSGSTRDLKGSQLLEDLLAIQRFIQTRGIRRIGIVGSSMGGWATSWFTLLHGISVVGCVLLAPAFRFLYRRWDSLSPDQMSEWQRTGFLRLENEWINIELGYGLIAEREQFPCERLMQEWSKPLLIFHGLVDNVVPIQESWEFVEKTPYLQVELRIFKDGDHRLVNYKDEIAQEACRFLSEWGKLGSIAN